MIRRATMQLSPQTLKVLQNFQSINTSLIVKAGNNLQSNSTAGLRAYAVNLEDTFPNDFAIYDFKGFMSLLKLVGKDADLTFNLDHVLCKNGNKSIKYYYSSPDVIQTLKPTPKFEANTNNDLEFTLSPEDLKSLLSAASAIDTSFVSINSNDKGSWISTWDEVSGNMNSYNQNLAMAVADESNTFMFVVSVQSLKNLVPDTYIVKLDKRGIIKFEGSDCLTYYIGAEKDHSLLNDRKIT